MGWVAEPEPPCSDAGRGGGNAWSAGHQYLRYKKLKMAKVASLERYLNSPDDTPLAELRSKIHLFVR